MLGVRLDRTQPAAYMGISNTTLQGSDIKGIKALALTMCADADTTAPVSIKLRLYKQGTKTLSAGNGSVVYDYTKEEILRMRHQEFTLKDFLIAINPIITSLTGLYVYYTPKTVAEHQIM